MTKIKKIAVRELVEFIYQKGSIDSRITSLDNKAASLGIKLHGKVQKEGGSTYEKEVPLTTEITIGTEQIIIEGRADGIIFENDTYMIDEIKTSSSEYEQVPEEQLDLYWYQVMCYGKILCDSKDLEKIMLQLTYISTTTSEITRIQKELTKEVVNNFWSEMIGLYEKWIIFQQKWVQVRNTSMQKLKFPFDTYRKGQRELAGATYKTIVSNKNLFVEAPTGIGKTMSTLFPTIKAMGEDQVDKIFYLTAKTITRQVAMDAIETMDTKGMKAKAVTITAKDKICFLDKRNCTPEACPYANGYYTRLNDGMFDLLENEHIITRDIIEKYAKTHMICPFELSLDVSLWCDIIICDYNYLFDPIVYLRRFFQNEKEPYAFLIDEVHNLVSRSKEMFSAYIYRNDVLHTLELLPKKERRVRKSLNAILDELDILEGFMDEKETITINEPLEGLLKRLYKFTEIMKEWLPENLENPDQPVILQFYFDVTTYLKISELYDDHYCMFITRANENLLVKQLCLDPSLLLSQKLAKAKSSILFSATLSPLPYYREILGGKETSICYQVPSPFDEKNQLLLQANYVRTTYKERQNSLSQIVDSIYQMVQGKMGNYFVFFPSYTYMRDVYDAFINRYPDIQTLLQDSGWSEAEKDMYLEEFSENPLETLLGFFVLGGVFSEGIDLKGERLIGVAIVGVGLPQMNEEQELLRTYYTDQGKDGFQYAYQIPGMNKVLQAAGRVIRGIHDTGVILLLDTRFSTRAYQQLMPAYWQHLKKVQSVHQLEVEVSTFWQK